MKLCQTLRTELCLRLVSWGKFVLEQRREFRRLTPLFPTVSLCDDLKAWGRCTCEGYLCHIELRTALLEEHPWYAACDVFLHEIAHWLTYCQVGTSETAHGETFRKICRSLGITPAASGNYEPLDTTLFLDDDALEARLSPTELKIRKLLALSESPNEHEAHLALMKARELMSKYDMEHIEATDASESSDPFITMYVSLGKQRIDSVEWEMAWLLSQYYDVTCIGDLEHVVEDGRVVVKKVIAVSGRRSKVKIALYVRDFIRNYMEMKWMDVVLSHWKGVRARRDFELGALAGICETLEKQRMEAERNVSGDRTALVKAELKDYVSRRYPRMVKTRGNSIRVDKESRAAGREAGLSMEFHSGIEGNGGASAPKQLR